MVNDFRIAVRALGQSPAFTLIAVLSLALGIGVSTSVYILTFTLFFAPPAGVVSVKLRAEEIAATREQLQLFVTKPRRDVRAANDAFAGLRAEFGNECVVKAVMRDGHLPEARFGWEPLLSADTPRPTPGATPRPVVRRLFARPQPLPGVASLGTRPTVNGTEPLLEAHIFDFAGDLYRRHLEIEFIAKLREERKFASLEAMVVQMHEDARRARDILNVSKPGE